ncbi:hypothetical protein AB0B54_17110 [Microbispora bryophytorum]|uniref:hypothetical protein n=2 Tax=Microbispora bryophytorum TaxID=1460882 RepID=UPI0033CC4542
MPERSKGPADDPFGGRKPTSHERMTGLPWDASYHDGPAAADALRLDRLGRGFETVLDCGLFHTFDGDERSRYVRSLASVTERGGTLHVLCFSDQGPGTGPHPVGREELGAAFAPGGGWSVVAVEPDRVRTRYHDDGAPAWLATIRRI